MILSLQNNQNILTIGITAHGLGETLGGQEGSFCLIYSWNCTWIDPDLNVPIPEFASFLSVFAECHTDTRSLIDKILVFEKFRTILLTQRADVWFTANKIADEVIT